MPIYDYACADCGHHFELIHRAPETGELTCPACGSSVVNKLISTPGLIRGASKPHGGQTCCGRDERCDKPPCSSDGQCRR